MTNQDTPASGRSNWQPTNKVPANLKTKMAMLVGMLLMVVYAMYEAGKPENWEWMNFADSGSVVESESESQPDVRSASASPPTESESHLANELKPNQPGRLPVRSDSSVSPPIRLGDAAPPTLVNARPSDVPVESQKFWRTFFAAMEPAGQLDFLQMLDRLQAPDRLRDALGLDRQQLAVVEQLTQRRSAFDDQLLDRMTSLPEASQEKSRSAEDYFEADEFWSQNIAVVFAALVNNDDVTLNQQRTAGRLARFLETEALNQVQDDTAIGWAGDAVAWNRCWKKIHAGSTDDSLPVKRIQLVAQPNEYRGQRVSVRGLVRLVELRTAKENSSVLFPGSPDKRYFIVWIKPLQSKAGPYCVYTNQLPASLPTDSGQLKDFSATANIEGLFFKNRRYLAASGEVASCPLILASSLTLEPVPPAAAATVFWNPGPRTTIVLAWLLPLVAIGGSYCVFRASRTRKRLPSDKSQQKIGIFLGELTDDPSIQTELEKVQAISEPQNETE